MPTSFPQQIPSLIEAIDKIHPRTILDIGCGNGKMGHLVREYFDGIEIDALEVFEPYIKDCHRENYGTITIGNALTEEVKPYDLYLIIDVIEHWPKVEAMNLLRRLVEHGKVIVSTPKSVGEQGAEHGNEWERHISQWIEEDWDEFNREAIPSEFAFIQILSKK